MSNVFKFFNFHEVVQILESFKSYDKYFTFLNIICNEYIEQGFMLFITYDDIKTNITTIDGHFITKVIDDAKEYCITKKIYPSVYLYTSEYSYVKIPEDSELKSLVTALFDVRVEPEMHTGVYKLYSDTTYYIFKKHPAKNNGVFYFSDGTPILLLKNDVENNRLIYPVSCLIYSKNLKYDITPNLDKLIKKFK